jgi:hypothetical protein
MNGSEITIGLFTFSQDIDFHQQQVMHVCYLVLLFTFTYNERLYYSFFFKLVKYKLIILISTFVCFSYFQYLNVMLKWLLSNLLINIAYYCYLTLELIFQQHCEPRPPTLPTSVHTYTYIVLGEEPYWSFW